eukprot:UN04262
MNPSGNIVYIGAPDDENGIVHRYVNNDITDENSRWIVESTKTHINDNAVSDLQYGSAIGCTETEFGHLLVVGSNKGIIIYEDFPRFQTNPPTTTNNPDTTSETSEITTDEPTTSLTTTTESNPNNECFTENQECFTAFSSVECCGRSLSCN